MQLLTSTMTSIIERIHVASYNCHVWNSSILYVKKLLKDFDLLLIQEHWLFTENLSLLNVKSDFSSFGISGMENTVFLTGRSYGGCGFLIRKSLLPFTGSNNICFKQVLCSTPHHKLGKNTCY